MAVGDVDGEKRDSSLAVLVLPVTVLAAELLARAPPAPTPHAAVQKRAKDTMTEFAALFASIAAA
jgi:hypothetical protein